MSVTDEVITEVEGIRDAAARLAAKLRGTNAPLPGSYCVHCGELINGVNGSEECPVSRYMARLTKGGGGITDAKQGEVHGQGHLWSGGHVEDWFNYSGPRGAEKGWT